MKRQMKPKGFRGTKGFDEGGQLSRAKKPADKTGRHRAKKSFPGSK